MPKFQEMGVPLLFVSMGSTKDLSKWQAYTQFPPDQAYLDQQEVFYTGLKANKGMLRSLLHPYMWTSVLFRKIRDGTIKRLARAGKEWTVQVPDKTDQSWLQGGVFIFRGKKLIWAHRDATPGDYADMKAVLRAVCAELPTSMAKDCAACQDVELSVQGKPIKVAPCSKASCGVAMPPAAEAAPGPAE